MSEDQPKQQQKSAANKSEIFSTDKYAETLQNMWFHFLHSRSQHLHPDEYKESIYSQHRLISPRLIEHIRNITNFLGTGRPH